MVGTTHTTKRGCQPSQMEVDMAAALICCACALGEMAKLGSGRDTVPPPGTISGFVFSPQASFIRLAATSFPHKPHLTRVLRLPQHHCCSIPAVPVRGSKCPQEKLSAEGEGAQVHRSHLPTETAQAAVTEI